MRSKGRIDATRLSVGASSLKRAEKAIAKRVVETAASAATETPRWELRREIIALLRNRTTTEEAKPVGKLWKLLETLFDGFQNEIAQTPLDDLYGIIRAVKDGLARLPVNTASYTAMLSGAQTVFGAIGEGRTAELFAIGHGFNDGIHILTHTISNPGPPERVLLSTSVAQALAHVAAGKSNVSGIGHFTVRHFLVPYLKFRQTLAETAPLDHLLTEIFLHPSMSKQFSLYLSINAASIQLGKERISTEGKTPTISAFLESLSVCMASESSALQLMPYLWSQFWERLAAKGILSRKRAGFLLAAEFIDLILAIPFETAESQKALLELLRGIERHQLYEPTLDEGFLQLQFLQRLGRKLCLPEASQQLLTPRKKKPKLLHPTSTPEAALKLEICDGLMKIEHRSFTPCMTELLTLLGAHADETLARDLLLHCMAVTSNARKWTCFVASLLAALAQSHQLSTLLKCDAALELFRRGIEQLPPMEIQNCLEVMMTAIQKQKWDLWSKMPSDISAVLLDLVEAAVTSVKIRETNALTVANILIHWMPPLSALQWVNGSIVYSQFLRISQAMQQRMEECCAWHPAAEKTGFRNLPVEVLVLHGAVPGEVDAQWLLADGLIQRLEELSHQELHHPFQPIPRSAAVEGGDVVEAMVALMKSMKVEAARKLWVRLITTHFVPWITFCSPSVLTQFLERGLDDFQHHALLFEALFRDPVALGCPKFIQAWIAAFFSSFEKEAASCQLPTMPLLTQTSTEVQAQRIRKALLEQLQLERSLDCVRQGDVTALWARLEFGLKLTVFSDVDRWRLESYAVALSLNSPSRCLSCFSLFSLSALQSQKTGLPRYYSTLIGWTLQICRSAFAASPRESLSTVQTALFAVMKQLIFSQCSAANAAFFSPSGHESSKKAPLWSCKRLMAMDLLDEMKRGERGFGMVSVGVFVRLCSWLGHRQQPPSLSCLKGSSLPTPWPGKLYQQLKNRSSLPDYSQIPFLCQHHILPYLQDSFHQDRHTQEAPWWEIWVGMSAGMVMDLSEILTDAQTHLQSFIAPVLMQIEALVLQRSWQELPLCLDRVAQFLHRVCDWMQPGGIEDGALLGMAQLQLSFFVKLIEECRPTPESQPQSFLLMHSVGEISMRDSFSTASIRTELLNAFNSVLASAERLEGMSEMLMSQLEAATTLEMKFGALQFLTVLLQRLKTTESEKLSGALFLKLNSCFWHGYFRHVLLRFVERQGIKSVPMPTPEQKGIFTALLCCFFRAFRICHSCSNRMDQRITIQIMRRIKRLIQTLCRRTDYAQPNHGLCWFGEICGFLISAVHHQKTEAAAKALFPSFRAALESLLSLLLAWELQTEEISPGLEQAEVQLGMVYSDTSQSIPFTEGLPDLLYSFHKIMDTLRTRRFTKQNPLKRCFERQDVGDVDAMQLVKRVRQRVLTVYSAISRPQRRDLKSQLASEPFLAAQLHWFDREDARFSGHDG